jgi:hypothetical protein
LAIGALHEHALAGVLGDQFTSQGSLFGILENDLDVLEFLAVAGLISDGMEGHKCESDCELD